MTDPPPHPVVGVGIVVWRGERVLLVRRARPPRRGEWSIPGGRQELGETVFQTARREAREETGLDVRPREILTVIDAIRRDGAGAVVQHYTLVEILAAADDGPEPVAGSDAAAVRWAALDEVDRLVAWDETRRLIRLADRRRRQPVAD